MTGVSSIRLSNSWKLSAGGICVIVVLTLWHALGAPGPPLYWGIVAAALMILVRERRRIGRNLAIMASSLVAVTLLLLPAGQDPGLGFERGVYIGSLLVSLVASVSILGGCALRSPVVSVVGDCLLTFPAFRRYVPFTLTSQVFSAMLSLAGTNVLFAIAARDEASPRRPRIAMFSAITRGFSAATFWSPMFGNMAILLALYPSLNWLTVLPLGFVLAQLTVVVGACLDRSGCRQAKEERDRIPWPPGALRAAATLLAIMLAYLVALVLVSAASGLSITSCIVLLTPLAAILINTATAARPGRVTNGLRALWGDLSHLPKIAPEILIFMVAGCAGTIIADAIPAAWVSALSSHLAPAPWLGISTLMVAIMMLSVLGVHPVLSAVLLASTLPPQMLALPALPHFGAVLMGWGLAASLTPFSVLNLTASRQSGIALMRISVGANWRFTMVCLVLVTLILSLLVPVTR
jgi:hypothetical protein